MIAETPVEKFAAALDRCAEDALWEAGVDQPPVDAFTLAQRLGIEVAGDSNLRGRARFLRPRPLRRSETPRAAILLGPEPRRERRHWAVAHEVGESIAQRVFDLVGLHPSEAPALSRERVANALAGRLLAPKRWLRGVHRDAEGDLTQIKQTFVTASHELLVRRLLEVIEAPIVVTLYDQNQLVWRRWNRPGSPPPCSPEETNCQRAAHQDAQTMTAAVGFSDDGPFGIPGMGIRCWPVHEPAWKREITISELAECEWI